MQKHTYIVQEDLVVEDELGSELFFICNGKVALIHKKTKTFLKDLKQDGSFGEIGFFSEKPRQVSIKARDFTDVFIISREPFLELALKISE